MNQVVGDLDSLERARQPRARERVTADHVEHAGARVDVRLR